MARKVLLVDGSLVNLRILKHLLAEEYEPLCVSSAEEAFAEISRGGAHIAAVLCELVLPGMNGLAFLKCLQDSPHSRIPVIITTTETDAESERRALECGAWDFIAKPYDGKILRLRLRNAVAHSELATHARLSCQAQFDTLTGLYNREAFEKQVRARLSDDPDTEYAIYRFDIDHFSLINSFYGMDTGDALLRYVAKQLLCCAEQQPQMLCCRIEADRFAFFLPITSPEQPSRVLERVRMAQAGYPLKFNIVLSFGVYRIDEPELPVNAMLARAAMAAKKIKGSYANSVCVYTPSMRRTAERRQELCNEMADALRERQFCVFLQPKYDLNADRFRGAEALVRWQHPKRGMISPGEFIPVFERNGFIMQLDHYVWETVCALLKKWRDAGFAPAPVSVNVSRVDLYNPALPDELCALTERYGIPRPLLELEITESAIIDDPKLLQKAQERLHNAGFTLLMDDFGSGYSALSTLKDIDVDILKIDMGFFGRARSQQRSRQVVASVLGMSRALGLPVVAEGVEKADEVAFLRSSGCEFVQGFYFARPMPVEEYEGFGLNRRAEA